MAELSLPLDLFAHADRRPEPVCTGCGRSEAEAPAYVINDLGRFCLDCEAIAFNWTPDAVSRSLSSGPNPALAGKAEPSREREGGRA